MRFSEEVQAKLTILKVKEWETFQIVLRVLRKIRLSKKKMNKTNVELKSILCGGLLAMMLVAVPCNGIAGESDGSAVAVMEEVVVTATKTEEKRKDIANSVVVLDSIDIAESPAQNVGQLLANESGVDWRSRGNYGGAAQEIQIRGMDSDETQVLVNGMIVNSPSLGRADLGTIPMDFIARVEVVKGAGSLLYGSGAMAGIVNIFTKKPERDAPVLAANIGYGSENTYRISAEQGMFAGGDFGYYLTVGKSGTDGFRDNSDLEQSDLSLNLILDKGDALEVSLFGSYVDREFGVPGIKPPAGTGDYFINGVRFYSSESASTLDNGASEDGSLVLKMAGRLHEVVKGDISVDYLHNKSTNVSRYNADSWTTFAGAGLESVVTNKVSGIEGNLEITPLPEVKVLLGADYSHHDWESGSTDLDTSGAKLPGGSTNSAALHTQGTYLEVQYRPLELVKLFAGIRHEEHSTFGGENVPRYGLIINPGESTALKMNYGKFFKAPTPNDLFWPEDDFARGNPDLDPQTGWHTDLTLEQGFMSGRGFAFLSYYDWQVDGKITWAPNPAFPGPFGDKWTPTNLNSSEGSGWEAGFELDPAHNLSFAFSYTYTDASEETAPGQWREAQYMAQNRCKVKATWRGDRGTTASVVSRYVGERDFFRTSSDTTPTDTLDSYVTLDVRLEQRLYENLLLSLDIGNMFDEEHDTYVGSFVDSTGSRIYGAYPGGGRSLFLSVGYDF